MIDQLVTQLNPDLTQLSLFLAQSVLMITVFILFYTRPPRYLGKLMAHVKGEALEVVNQVQENFQIMMVGGLDKEGNPAPGIIEMAVSKMFEKAQYTAMGEESGASRRRQKLLGNVVSGVIPPAAKIAAKHFLGWDEDFIAENASDIIAIWPQIQGIIQGGGVDLKGLMGMEGVPQKTGGTHKPGI